MWRRAVRARFKVRVCGCVVCIYVSAIQLGSTSTIGGTLSAHTPVLSSWVAHVLSVGLCLRTRQCYPAG